MTAQLAEETAGHARMLRDSVDDFVARGTDVARVRTLRGTDPGYDRAVWRQMAELGWLGILVPESRSGLGLGFTEMRIVVEGLATVLAPEPVTASAVLAGGVLRHVPACPKADELLGELVAGEVIPALAWQEQSGNLAGDCGETRARAFEGGFKLEGTKRFVRAAAGADGFVVSAEGPDGMLLAWLPAATAGHALATTPLADGTTMGTLRLADVVVPREHVLAQGNPAQQALSRALDETTVMAGAELCGVMRRTMELSLDYMRTRVQFGKPIGAFQALAHRAVDLHIQRELASAVLDDAVALLDANAEPVARAAAASRVKARCSEAALRVTREAIQIHGAIGFTDEYDAGLYLKRALVLSAWLGNGALHRRRYAQLIPSDLA